MGKKQKPVHVFNLWFWSIKNYKNSSKNSSNEHFFIVHTFLLIDPHIFKEIGFCNPAEVRDIVTAPTKKIKITVLAVWPAFSSIHSSVANTKSCIQNTEIWTPISQTIFLSQEANKLHPWKIVSLLVAVRLRVASHSTCCCPLAFFM